MHRPPNTWKPLDSYGRGFDFIQQFSRTCVISHKPWKYNQFIQNHRKKLNWHLKKSSLLTTMGYILLDINSQKTFQLFVSKVGRTRKNINLAASLKTSICKKKNRWTIENVKTTRPLALPTSVPYTSKTFQR